MKVLTISDLAIMGYKLVLVYLSRSSLHWKFLNRTTLESMWGER